MYQKQLFVIKLQRRFEEVMNNTCIRMAIADAMYLSMHISVTENTKRVEHAHVGMFLEDFFLDARIKQIDDICKSLSNGEGGGKTQYVLFTKEDKRLYIDSKIWKKL